ncbi:unnamed protein product, partial [Phaeothamnion confervicola]
MSAEADSCMPWFRAAAATASASAQKKDSSKATYVTNTSTSCGDAVVGDLNLGVASESSTVEEATSGTKGGGSSARESARSSRMAPPAESPYRGRTAGGATFPTLGSSRHSSIALGGSTGRGSILSSGSGGSGGGGSGYGSGSDDPSLPPLRH